MLSAKVVLPLTGGKIPGRKRISTRQFALKFADIAEQALSAKLPAEEQETRVAAFERAVSTAAGRQREKLKSLMKRLRHVRAGRHFSREEMNER
ncbi:MAG TPA: hypothetical protein VKU44_04345 [Terriglobia bacterium]|nr:hypothetical protein [Terriglobia bacterium]